MVKIKYLITLQDQKKGNYLKLYDQNQKEISISNERTHRCKATNRNIRENEQAKR